MNHLFYPREYELMKRAKYIPSVDIEAEDYARGLTGLCPACGKPITEKDRIAANDDKVIFHYECLYEKSN